MNDLTDDTTYTVSVNVSPENPGTVTGQTGNGNGKINVFKPELTYKDSEVYYGDTAPTDFSANLVKTEWKHGDTLNTTVTMIGDAPKLQFEYKPKSGVDASNKISTKKDIPVSVDVRVDGMAANEGLNDFITFQHISIPKLELELPVMSEWDYVRLKIAPCRQFGSSRTDDLVIAAHNYESHFGYLYQLELGDQVIFTDMDGIENLYEVTGLDTLNPIEVDAVQNSGHDLVLYTCTYEGKTRVTVFCDRKKETPLR